MLKLWIYVINMYMFYSVRVQYVRQIPLYLIITQLKNSLIMFENIRSYETNFLDRPNGDFQQFPIKYIYFPCKIVLQILF